MSERRPSPRVARRASSRATTIRVTLLSLTVAAALTGGLAAQMAAGHDPALGSGQKTGQRHTKPSGTPNAQSGSSLPAAPPPASVVTSAS